MNIVRSVSSVKLLLFLWVNSWWLFINSNKVTMLGEAEHHSITQYELSAGWRRRHTFFYSLHCTTVFTQIQNIDNIFFAIYLHDELYIHLSNVFFTLVCLPSLLYKFKDSQTQRHKFPSHFVVFVILLLCYGFSSNVLVYLCC